VPVPGTDVVDLRSDTKTLPDAEMRLAMSEAEVGDDKSGEDPTMRRLEEMSAERLGNDQAHMRLVIAMASKFRGFGLPLNDMIQEGYIQRTPRGRVATQLCRERLREEGMVIPDQQPLQGELGI